MDEKKGRVKSGSGGKATGDGRGSGRSSERVGTRAFVCTGNILKSIRHRIGI